MDTNRVYHYVYRITNVIENKHYYGKRSSKIEPKLDLGIKYFSSSKDKEFIQDQKINPKNYKYKIISLYKNEKEALLKEIKLHNKFDVGINEKFYNRSKQTSTGFDTTGTIFSVERRKEISKFNKGRTHTEATKNKISNANKGKPALNKGKKHTEESKNKMKKAAKGRLPPNQGKNHTEETKNKISEATKGINNHRSKIANIYSYFTNELITKTPIIITEWCKINKYSRSALSATARADRSLPHNSRNNPLYHKGLYAIYI